MDRPWLSAYETEVSPRLDYPQAPLQHFLTETARNFPRHPAIDFYGKRLTYDTLAALVARCANALRSNGVRPGDRVALMLPNVPQAVIGYYGALTA
ncbi:MAG TPA: AMP-binding protein, partial [Nitrospiria bacterium]|nr:AMP-binding protein [Nitrospiria bacterium]